MASDRDSVDSFSIVAVQNALPYFPGVYQVILLSHFQNVWHRQGRSVFATLAMLSVMISPSAFGVTVPFTEAFPTDAAGWVYNVSTPAVWNTTGGVGNTSYISSVATPSGMGFGVNLFRGNDANNASGDAFVGNWLTAGVGEFSTSLRHDAPEPLNVFIRLDAGFGAGASSVSYSVPSNTWTLLSLPIVDSVTSFQSYGSGTFNGIFSSMLNVQLFLSSTQHPDVIGNSYNFGLDNPAVAAVPEPGTWVLLAGSAVVIGLGQLRRMRLPHAA